MGQLRCPACPAFSALQRRRLAPEASERALAYRVRPRRAPVGRKRTSICPLEGAMAREGATTPELLVQRFSLSRPTIFLHMHIFSPCCQPSTGAPAGPMPNRKPQMVHKAPPKCVVLGFANQFGPTAMPHKFRPPSTCNFVWTNQPWAPSTHKWNRCNNNSGVVTPPPGWAGPSAPHKFFTTMGLCPN